MQSHDEEILNAICAGDDGAPGWLFTVAATAGSSPRPPGSLLWIDAEGRQTGSVSGGCVEEDLVARVRAGELDAGCPRLVTYGITRDEALRFGLPCGGRLDLLAERIEGHAQWRVLRDAVAARRTLARRVCRSTGEVSLHPPGEGPEFRAEPGHLTRVFGPVWQLVIVGAAHISRFLVPIAHALGYRVLVCDPREGQLREWDLPEAELDRRMPDDLVRERGDDPRSAVVALTHDPRLDDMALMEALTSRAFYVGALGSRRSQVARRERLAQLGLPAQAIARLRGPVGLPIGGRTPAEIAVAIAADLVAVRNGRRLAEANEVESF
jgi:xanthine dehydrogenase accessory factor